MKKSFLIAFVALLGCSPKLTPGIVHLNELQGQWGMFKDRHPDGWGNWTPPYLYYHFNSDSTYYQTILRRKGNSLIHGKYRVLGDSMIVFYDSNGIFENTIGKIKDEDTIKLNYLDNKHLELHIHWYTLFGKKKKPWKWRMKFRPLNEAESKTLNATNAELLKRYREIESKN